MAVYRKSTATLLSESFYDAAGERVAKADFGTTPRFTQYLRDGAAVLWEKSWQVGNAVPETQKSYYYAGGRMAVTREAVAQQFSAASYAGMLIAAHGGQAVPLPTLGDPEFTYFANGTHADLNYTLQNLGEDVQSFTVRVARVQPNGGSGSPPGQTFEQTLDRPSYGWPSGAAYLSFPGLLTGWEYKVSLTVKTTLGTVPVLGPRTVTVEAGSLLVPTGPEAAHAWTLHKWVGDGQGPDGTPRVSGALAIGWRHVAPNGSGLYTLSMVKNGQIVPLTDAPVAGESALILQSAGPANWCDQTAAARDIAIADLGGGGATSVLAPIACTDLCADPGTGVVYSYTWASYATDHLGTVRAILTENPDLTTGVQTFDYEPFGVEIPGGNTGCDNTHRFTGHERDTETGNDYMHFRYFAAGMGRFMKPDSVFDGKVGELMAWNLYLYVRDNPINMNDPTGHVVNVANLSKEAQATLLKELTGLTGNTYVIDSKGNLQLGQKGQNSKAAATAKLDSWINSKVVYTVTQKDKAARGNNEPDVTQGACPKDSTEVQLDPRDFEYKVEDTAGVHSSAEWDATTGIASVFIHEMFHAADKLPDQSDKETGVAPAGTAEGELNKFRSDAGLPVNLSPHQMPAMYRGTKQYFLYQFKDKNGTSHDVKRYVVDRWRP